MNRDAKLGEPLNESVVEVLRGAVVESRHRVSVAVVDADGVLRAASGDAGLVVFARSAVKPFQVLSLVEEGLAERFGFGAEELALACASHSGEARHVELARRMLAKLGLDETALACGAHAPFHDASARELRRSGRAPTRLHNNCSGKHAAMIALAVGHGWPVAGYHEQQHPVQQRMLEVMSAWSDVPLAEIGVGVDGCGVATFALPLDRLAHAFARLAHAARPVRPARPARPVRPVRPDGAPSGKGAAGTDVSADVSASTGAGGADAGASAAARRVYDAMVDHPELVGGTGRLCTLLMRAADRRLVAKVGAEGVYCAAVPGAGVGIALKVEDGAKRAAEPALLAVLSALGVLDAEALAPLQSFVEPAVENTRREQVGVLRARIVLNAAGPAVGAGEAGSGRRSAGDGVAGAEG